MKKGGKENIIVRNNNMNNQVIQMLIYGNDPNGIKILELVGWTGKVFIIPRNNLKEIKRRSEINNPAVYFLFGLDEESIKENVYIGESESFFGRLENHDINKDFWNLAIVFVGQLDRADVKYLENKSTIFAREANRYEVLNKVQPQENKLLEFKKITIDEFFEKMRYLLTVLGYSVFQSTGESIKDNKIYILKVGNIIAKGRLLDNGDFMILKGSFARIRETENFVGGFAYASRRQFLSDGRFKENDKSSYLFTEDIIFKSPSAAAATICGYRVNGWAVWKDQNGNTLDENVRK